MIFREMLNYFLKMYEDFLKFQTKTKILLFYFSMNFYGADTIYYLLRIIIYYVNFYLLEKTL